MVTEAVTETVAATTEQLLCLPFPDFMSATLSTTKRAAPVTLPYIQTDLTPLTEKNVLSLNNLVPLLALQSGTLPELSPAETLQSVFVGTATDVESATICHRHGIFGNNM